MEAGEVLDGFRLVPQEWWELLIAGYLFLGGMAGMMVPVAYYYWRTRGDKLLSAAGGSVAFAAMVVGLVLLVLDLGRPWNVLALAPGPRLNWGSWMTIGTYVISAFTLATGLYALQFLPLGGLVAGRRGLADALGLAASLLGVATAAYTGFLLAAARGIQFWNNAVLPALFAASALSTGLCAYCAIVAPILLRVAPGFRESAGRVRLQLQRLEVYVLAVEAFLLFALLDVSLRGPPGARLAALELVAGSLAPLFWAGAVAAGIAAPMAILLLYTLRRPGEDAGVVAASAAAGLLVLAGALALRYAVLAAGVTVAPLA